METVLTIIHVLTCFVLIAVVLLQKGKGADIGAAFGGSSQTLFGSRGAATFLNKVTTVCAVVFMLTSLVLAVASSRQSSVVDKLPAKEQAPALPSAPQLPTEPIKQQTPPSEAQPPKN